MEMTLELPQNFVELDQDEMMYLDGGAWNSVRNVGIAIDVVIGIFTFGKSVKSGVALRGLLNSSSLMTNVIRTEITRLFGNTVSNAVTFGLNTAFTMSGTSAGNLIARGLDAVDGRVRGVSNNGIVFG